MRQGALVVSALALLAMASLLWILAGDGPVRKGPDLPPKEEDVASPPRRVELVSPGPTTPFSSPGQEVVDRGDAPPAPSLRKAARPAGAVVLFEHALHSDPHEQGLRWPLMEGVSEAGALFADDQASAVEVPDHLQVTLFENPGLGGHRLTLGPGRHNLASYGFNDLVSSARVGQKGGDPASSGPPYAVELFEHRAEDRLGRGRVWRLDLAESRDERLFSAPLGDFDGGAVSTAWVPPGYELTLFAEPEGRGLAVVLGSGMHELDFVQFNDRAQAARVRRLR